MNKDFLVQRNTDLYNIMNNNNNKLEIYNSNKKIFINKKNDKDFIIDIIGSNKESKKKILNINQLKSLLKEVSKLNIDVEALNFDISEIYSNINSTNVNNFSNILENNNNYYSPVGFDTINLNNEEIEKNKSNNNFRIDNRDPNNLCGS